MPPQLFESQDLKQFVKGTDAAGHCHKGVGFILQNLLALPHGIGIEKLVTMGVEHAVHIEKPGCNADDPAFFRLYAPGCRTHQAFISAAEQQSVASFAHGTAKGLHAFQIGRMDVLTGCTV